MAKEIPRRRQTGPIKRIRKRVVSFMGMGIRGNIGSSISY
jgi:hypothetical protein